jgi:hypothetical protein
LFAASATTAVDDFSAVGGFHSLAETMLGFTAAFAWLVSTFHF